MTYFTNLFMKKLYKKNQPISSKRFLKLKYTAHRTVTAACLDFQKWEGRLKIELVRMVIKFQPAVVVVAVAIVLVVMSGLVTTHDD